MQKSVKIQHPLQLNARGEFYMYYLFLLGSLFFEAFIDYCVKCHIKSEKGYAYKQAVLNSAVYKYCGS